MKNRPVTPVRPGRGPAGFTLIELLVVIGIIAVLISLLMPVVGKVRLSAQNASSKAMLKSIDGAIQTYISEHHYPPGLFSNDQIHGGIGMPTISSLTTPSPANASITYTAPIRPTMAENLVLSLAGGLTVANNSGTLTYTYDPKQVGQGPVKTNSLGEITKGSAYLPEATLGSSHLSAGWYKDESGGAAADDTNIPEFVDQFTEPLPILYMRARKGATGIVGDSNDVRRQYDVRSASRYTKYKLAGKDQGLNAITASNAEDDFNSTQMGPVNSGTKRYQLLQYLRAPGPSTGSVANQNPNATGSPRQKDGYVLICAGPDRVFGTEDDSLQTGGLNE